MKLTKKKKGFTLIELMAVIAIVAILATVLVPTVSGYIERAKKIAVITQIRNVVAAVETYNATTYGTAIIDGKTKIATLVDDPDDVLIKENLLSTKDVDRLGTELKVVEAKAINSDPNAISRISINNGIYSGY